MLNFLSILILIPNFAFGMGGSLPENNDVLSEKNAAAKSQNNCSIGLSACTAKNSQVQVDLQSRCMCVGAICFKVDIGYGGPMMTSNGTSIISPIQNLPMRTVGRYRTYADVSKRYDDDGLMMGPASNNNVGKWIHKARNCGPGGQAVTAGCVGVPCDKWPLIKSQMGKQITVCGGRGSNQTYLMPPPPSLSSFIDESISNARDAWAGKGHQAVHKRCVNAKCMDCVRRSMSPNESCKKLFSTRLVTVSKPSGSGGYSEKGVIR